MVYCSPVESGHNINILLFEYICQMQSINYPLDTMMEVLNIITF